MCPVDRAPARSQLHRSSPSAGSCLGRGNKLDRKADPAEACLSILAKEDSLQGSAPCWQHQSITRQRSARSCSVSALRTHLDSPLARIASSSQLITRTEADSLTSRVMIMQKQLGLAIDLLLMDRFKIKGTQTVQASSFGLTPASQAKHRTKQYSRRKQRRDNMKAHQLVVHLPMTCRRLCLALQVVLIGASRSVRATHSPGRNQRNHPRPIGIHLQEPALQLPSKPLLPCSLEPLMCTLGPSTCKSGGGLALMAQPGCPCRRWSRGLTNRRPRLSRQQ